MTAGLMAAPPLSFFEPAPDRIRMQRDRMHRLRSIMAEQGLDALVLSGNANVAYASGLVWPLSDSGRASFERPVAVVLADDDVPHLFTPLRLDDQTLGRFPSDHLHGPTYLDFDEGVEQFATALSALVPSGAVLAFDDWTHAMRRDRSVLLGADPPRDAGQVVGRAKLIKTPDELAFMREGLRLTEVAVAEVQRSVAPGIRQSDLSATFLGAMFAAGAEANVMDPIWQVMPARVADGPWTTTGDLACPLLNTERVLERGDVLWVDVSATYGGFHSDFGRTWIVGREPDERQRAQFRHWRSILTSVLEATRAGARAAELTAAAKAGYDGGTPWLRHFYLGHGLGIDSAEMPFIGSDLGSTFDENYVLEAGMVLVLEPIVWEDGAAGYRAEEVVVITDDGWLPMTDYPYDPF